MSYRAVTSGLALLYKIRVDPNSAKRQKRLELKRAAEWENATGVITGKQAAFEKAVRRYRYQFQQSKACVHHAPTCPACWVGFAFTSRACTERVGQCWCAPFDD